MENIGSSRRLKSKSKAKKDDEDFQEDEVWQNWALVKDSNFRPKNPESSSSSAGSKIPSVFKRNVSKVNSTASSCGQSSAPMSIPDWSKIKDDSWGSAKSYDVDDGHYDDGDDDEMIPPHEIVARRQARNPIVSYSMCEGAGRTLKGRDLSKLRNSILTKTGFLE